MTSAQRGHEVRQRLLDAAAELIAERGWAAVSTRAVAERAGVAPGLVHYHFTSVQELLSRAAIAVMHRVTVETGPLLAGAGDPGELAEALVASLGAYSGTDPVSVLFVETYLAATRDPELRAGVAEVIAQFRSGLAIRLAELGLADPESTAAVLCAAIDGLVLQQALDPTLSAAAVRPVIRRTLVTTERQEDGP
ncbi:TetR/AcrR family transcriptional regulator [Pseudonocardia parietis]|uniref:AcrR family transcriptional regulator n=1 Tax=Pseudonocardia parietis TaxID=570936 RepID=A0ABS4VWI6_9PSEU|nr:TetR/AcrR family transcriptional regulator [Pseudonocardia parietis]MBP2368290.1 AcrR family transcriptional regulator [Pseudonocardia parietis]